MDVARSETVEREGREPGRGAPPPGGAAEMPGHIYRYVLAASGWHQLVLVGLTVAVFLLEVVPLELQRRIVNDLVKHREYWSIIALAAVDSIGGFVGGSVSEPLLQGGILLSVLAYMIHVDFWMAGTAFALFVPQLVFVPLMQGAMNRRTRARVQTLRQLSVSVVESAAGDDARRDRADDERIEQVFELNMGIYRFKFSMNFLMNLSTQLQIIGALLVGGWAVYAERLEIGGVVAFISGIGRITDPWGDLVNYFREVNITQVKYALVRDAIHQQAQDQAADET